MNTILVSGPADSPSSLPSTLGSQTQLMDPAQLFSPLTSAHSPKSSLSLSPTVSLCRPQEHPQQQRFPSPLPSLCFAGMGSLGCRVRMWSVTGLPHSGWLCWVLHWALMVASSLPFLLFLLSRHICLYFSLISYLFIS